MELSENRLKELVHRRNILEKKAALRKATLAEFDAVHDANLRKFTSKLYDESKAAQVRNEKMLQDMAQATVSAYTKLRDYSKTNSTAAQQLIEEKRRYKKAVENMQPVWKAQCNHMDEINYQKLKHDQQAIAHRRQMRLEEESKAEVLNVKLEAERREVLMQLALEQKDYMTSTMRQNQLNHAKDAINNVLIQELTNYSAQCKLEEMKDMPMMENSVPAPALSVPYLMTVPTSTHLHPHSIPPPAPSSPSHVTDLFRARFQQHSSNGSRKPPGILETMLSHSHAATHLQEPELSINTPSTDEKLPAAIPAELPMNTHFEDRSEDVDDIPVATIPAPVKAVAINPKPILTQKPVVVDTPVETMTEESAIDSVHIQRVNSNVSTNAVHTQDIIQEFSISVPYSSPGKLKRDGNSSSSSKDNSIKRQTSTDNLVIPVEPVALVVDTPATSTATSKPDTVESVTVDLVLPPATVVPTPLEFIPFTSLLKITQCNVILKQLYTRYENNIITISNKKQYQKYITEVTMLLYNNTNIIDSSTITAIQRIILAAQCKREKELIVYGNDLILMSIIIVVIEKSNEIMPMDLMNGIVTLDKLYKHYKSSTGLEECFHIITQHIQYMINNQYYALDEMIDIYSELLLNNYDQHVPAADVNRIHRKIVQVLKEGVLSTSDPSGSNANTISTANVPISKLTANVTATNTLANANPVAPVNMNTSTIAARTPVNKKNISFNASRFVSLEDDEYLIEDEPYLQPPAMTDLSVFVDTVVASTQGAGGQNNDEFDFL